MSDVSVEERYIIAKDNLILMLLKRCFVEKKGADWLAGSKTS